MSKKYTNGIVSPKGFDMSAAEPVDQREIIEFFTDLATLEKCYLGIEVKIEELDYAEYKLVRLPSSDLSNWELASSSQGEVGPEGPAGVAGIDGASAYDIYITNGGLLSEADWLLSLHGQDGIQGDPGVAGPVGPIGTSPLTTKGDIYTFSTVDSRVAIGIDGQVLTADSSKATGVKWAAHINFIYTQSLPEAVWNITHTLHKRCSVTVVDTSGTEVIGDKQYISDTNIIITFGSAFAGKAYLN